MPPVSLSLLLQRRFNIDELRTPPLYTLSTPGSCKRNKINNLTKLKAVFATASILREKRFKKCRNSSSFLEEFLHFLEENISKTKPKILRISFVLEQDTFNFSEAIKKGNYTKLPLGSLDFFPNCSTWCSFGHLSLVEMEAVKVKMSTENGVHEGVRENLFESEWERERALTASLRESCLPRTERG